MWIKAENGDANKPMAIDRESSPTTVYFRRNFVFVDEVTEGEQTRPAHWEYEEQAVSTDFYETYINIDDINNALVELAELVAEVING